LSKKPIVEVVISVGASTHAGGPPGQAFGREPFCQERRPGIAGMGCVMGRPTAKGSFAD